MPIVNLYYFDKYLHVDLLKQLLHIWKLYILVGQKKTIPNYKFDTDINDIFSYKLYTY